MLWGFWSVLVLGFWFFLQVLKKLLHNSAISQISILPQSLHCVQT